jgi:hypothetical protein
MHTRLYIRHFSVNIEFILIFVFLVAVFGCYIRWHYKDNNVAADSGTTLQKRAYAASTYIAITLKTK